MSWKVTAQNLDHFALNNLRRAEELAPLLIGKLIKASIDPTKFRFPNGDDIRLPGFDGELESEIPTTYIPEGISVWEISKSKDPDKKAKKDFPKRTPNCNITYVQYSFVSWPGSKKWRDLNAKAGWKQVRTVDGVDIADWLEDCPAVHRWLATILGKRIHGCRDVEEAWRFWQSGTEVKISEEILTCGRENQVEIFQQVLATNRYVQVIGESRFESLGFILTAIKSNDLLSSSFLQVENQQVFSEMATTKNPMTFLVDATTQDIGYALDHGHTVIVISDLPSVETAEVFRIDFVTNMQRTTTLVAMGFHEEKAYKIIEHCRNNLDLMRYLPVFRPRQGPDYDWLKIDNVLKVLSAAFVLGRWSWEYELDCKVFSNIARMDLVRCKTLVQILSEQASSPIQIDYHEMAVLSRPFLWNTVIKGKLTKADIFNTVKVVFNLDGEGTGLKQSHRLKTSVAELLNYFSSAIEAGYGTPIKQGDINYFVSRILEQENQSELASFLNTLAEAAPDTFLTNVDRWVSQNALHPEFLKEQNAHSVFKSLELLAWNRKFLAASSRILMQLAAAQESAISRCALSSFKRIFKIWSPKTSATLEERLQLIGRLIEEDPSVGWNLLMKLLPSSPTDNSYLSHKPSEREWHLDRSAITRCEVSKTVNKLVDLALFLVNSRPDQRWPELITRLSYSSDRNFDRIYFALEEYLNEENDRVIGNAIILNLKAFVAYEKAIIGSRYALVPHKLEKIEDLISKQKELPLYDHCKFLLTNHWELDVASSSQERAKKEEKRWKKKLDALTKLAAQNSADVARLFEEIFPKAHIGDLAHSLLSLKTDELIFAWLDSDKWQLVQIARNAIWEKSCREAAWIEEVETGHQDWTGDQWLSFTESYALSVPLLNVVSKLNQSEQNGFWTSRYRFILTEPNLASLDKAVSELFNVNRVGPVIDLVACAIGYDHDKINKEDVIRALSQYDASLDERRPPSQSGRQIRVLLQWLYKQDVEADTMINLEWKYLDELDRYNDAPITLLENIMKDPLSFVLFYREKTQEREKSEDYAIKGQIEDHLTFLYSLWEDQYSDLIDDEDMDAIGFLDAISVEAKNHGVGGTVSFFIGRMLSKVKVTGDTKCPNEIVCGLVDKYFNEDLQRGFIDGTLHPQPTRTGVFVVDRRIEYLDLSMQFQLAAEELAITHPNVASIMTSLSYEYVHKEEIGW